MPAHDVFVGVGSNIDPEANVPRALGRLAEEVRLTAVSTFYRTEPNGRPEQATFLNGVVRLETDRSAHRLKRDVLRAIEADLGRVRTGDAYAARTIDLDILLFDDAIIRNAELCIPDPDIRRRVFVAAPLLELAPGLVLPGAGEPLASAACLSDSAALVPVQDFTNALRERLGL